MGFWAGIKYALNSTLGTSDFKPLDKIIMLQNKFVSSDELYETIIYSENVSVAPDSSLVFENLPILKMTKNGSLKLKGNISVPSRSDSSATLYIMKNGNVIGNWSLLQTTDSNELGNTTKLFETYISFDLGDVLSFRFTVVNDYPLIRDFVLSNINVCGEIKETVFIKS